MKFEDLAKANKEIKTTNIKGKDYAEVNQRIKVFRMLFPNGSISTSIESLENGVVVMKAVVKDEEDHVLGTGYAYEKESSSFINKTSYIENCETSAVGRALGMLGIGIDTSVASCEEVQNAVAQQEELEQNAVEQQEELEKSENNQNIENLGIDKVKVKALIKRCERMNVPIENILNYFKINSIEELNEKQYSETNQILNEKEKKQ